MRQVPNWNDYFMAMIRTIATRSKHPTTQVGCVIVDPVTHTIRSGGYNGMVAGIPENDASWERPARHTTTCHAEFNAIALAARNGISTNGCVLYCTLAPCLTCTRLIIQAGIKEVYYPYGAVAESFVQEAAEAERLLITAHIRRYWA